MLKRIFHTVGFDLRRLTPNTNYSHKLLKGLNHLKIDLVLDVGANTGQFASELRAVGYKGQIVSFEPLSDAYELLAARAERDAKWRVHSRGAVGDYDGEIEINISGNSVSSLQCARPEIRLFQGRLASLADRRYRCS